MSSFIGLIKNENMKIYKRVSTTIMLALIVFLPFILSLVWKIFIEANVSMWDVVYIEFSLFYILVIIIGVIIAARSMADEFVGGTIKLLLIRPWTRSKILLSKYIAVLSFFTLASLLFIVALLIINVLFFGLNSEAMPPNMIDKSTTSEILNHLAQTLFLTWLPQLVMITLAFMISVLFKSSSMAIGFSLFVFLIVNNMIHLIVAIQKKWIDYILFVHLDLTMYLNDMPLRPNITMPFSIAVLAGYWVIFAALTWIVFNKRDIT